MLVKVKEPVTMMKSSAAFVDHAAGLRQPKRHRLPVVARAPHSSRMRLSRKTS